MSEGIGNADGGSPSYRKVIEGLKRIAPLPERETTLAYHLHLAAVGVAVLLLPLIYLGVIAGVVGALITYATEFHDVFFERGSMRAQASVIGILMLYFGPLVVGGIWILFLIKPLFHRRREVFRPPALSATSEPGLFAFVAHVSRLVNAPMPNEICVSLDVNASAGLRRGLRSLFADDLTLTIGLPLLAGLNQQQLAGVLAHELGHFSQHGGLRLSYVIRSINAWLARVVVERDALDRWLYAVASGIDLRVGIVFWLAILFVWLTRKVLWCLMVLGHAVSCAMLRQMEYDADRCEVQLTGAACFGRTTDRVTELSAASALATATLNDELRDHVPPVDDWPLFVLACERQIGAKALEVLREQSRLDRTRWLDTHPSTADRIAAARGLGARGLFRARRPSTELLSDWASLARLTTLDFYREGLGLDVDVRGLRAVELPPEPSPRSEPASTTAGTRDRPSATRKAAKPPPPEPGNKPPPPMPK